MKTLLCTGLLLAGLAIISGCQTWVPEAGITVPSPYYLKHPPQYFPPSEPYPLPKELRSLEEAGKQVYDAPRQ
ncbi:MAG: hypothetical protein HY289_16405 [Planctomycetes bacterium]|nr:hypothetical protein [Planctomycetota bacterium]